MAPSVSRPSSSSSSFVASNLSTFLREKAAIESGKNCAVDWKVTSSLLCAHVASQCLRKMRFCLCLHAFSLQHPTSNIAHVTCFDFRGGTFFEFFVLISCSSIASSSVRRQMAPFFLIIRLIEEN